MPNCPHDLAPGTCADCSPAAIARMPATAYGPWVSARYDGECAGCGDAVSEGDEIRADGEGGWLGRCCGGDDEPVRVLRDVTLVEWGPDYVGYEHMTKPTPGQFMAGPAS